MKKIKSLYILLAFGMLLVSCNSFLDLKPYGKTIPKTPDEYSALLHQFLNDVDYGTETTIIGNAGTISDYECISDNMETSLNDFHQAGALPAYVGDRIISMSQSYGKLYSQIKDCNIIIEGIKDEDKNTEKGNEVLGTAHALRGLCYYNLVRLFSEPYEKGSANNQLGVPIVKVFDMEERPVRDKLSDCVDFVIEDLKEAISHNVTKEEYRLTIDVAKFYLARTYFLKEDWENASVIAKELLDKYPLLEGDAYKNMLQEKVNMTGNVIFKSYIIPGSGDKLNYGSFDYLQNCPVSKSIIDLFVEGDDDIRSTFYFNKKRQNTKILNVKLRSAEMCLVLAESYAHMGSKNDLALQYLNLLRSKRIQSYTPYTLNTLPEVNENYLIKEDAEGKALTPLMYAILAERHKELYMEGDRWFELKRNGRPEFWVVNDLKFVTEKFLYTAPLPVEDVNLLDGLEQNDGYSL